MAEPEIFGTPDPYSPTEDEATDAEVSAAVAAAKGLPVGLTGALEPARFAGGTESGAPTTGTFAVGDFVVDQTGTFWHCVVAGSPGTWSAIAGTEIAYAEITSNQTFTTLADVTGLSIDIPDNLARPVLIQFGGLVQNDNATGGVSVFLCGPDGDTIVRTLRVMPIAANQAQSKYAFKRLPAGAGGVYKLRCQRITAGTATLTGSTEEGFFLRAVMA